MPITIDVPLSAAILACATVAAGTVKSITALAAPMAAAASDTIFTPPPASRAQGVAARAFQRGRQAAAVGARDLADQHLAHAPGGAGNGDLHLSPHELLGVD